MGALITPKQKALLQIARRELALRDFEYKEILRQSGGVTSSKRLKRADFPNCLNILRRLGFEPRANPDADGSERPGMASAAQLAYLRDLWAEYTAGEGNDESLRRWLERYFKVSHRRFLTMGAARGAIGTLKRMIARGGADTAS